MQSEHNLINSPLGKNVIYAEKYNPELLFPVFRQQQREQIGITAPLPFQGVDIWNAYELSWLNPRGKPCVAIVEFIFPCTSPKLIESKSFKLYLNSFNQTIFTSIDAVKETLYKDLSTTCGSPVFIKIASLAELHQHRILNPEGVCVDDVDAAFDTYELNAEFLTTTEKRVTETLYSNLLKSNCPITQQPDWASVQIIYTGNKIDQANLLKYFVSFRNHNEFHEHCVERIFTDISRMCCPEKLSVYARFTRRGGLDINPYRSSEDSLPKNVRWARQ